MSEKTEGKSKDCSSSNKKNKMEDGSKSKMVSGSKDMCDDSTGKKNNESEKTKNKDGYVYRTCELEGYRWDAILLNETWRQDKSEIWETHHKHVVMGAGRFDNKHGVGIMLNKAKNYRHRIHQRTGHHCHDRGKQPTHQTDECVLLPLGICGPPR